MKTILCGKIVKPQGIKGEVKVQTYVDNPQGFCTLQYVIINHKPIKIIKARSNEGFAFLLLENYNDRNAAESLRGAEVFVSLEDAKQLKEGDYFFEELIGLDAYIEETHIGKIVEIMQNKSADVFVIEGSKKYMVPFVKKAVAKIDIKKGIIVYHRKIFGEIAYEY